MRQGMEALKDGLQAVNTTRLERDYGVRVPVLLKAAGTPPRPGAKARERGLRPKHPVRQCRCMLPKKHLEFQTLQIRGWARRRASGASGPSTRCDVTLSARAQICSVLNLALSARGRQQGLYPMHAIRMSDGRLKGRQTQSWEVLELGTWLKLWCGSALLHCLCIRHHFLTVLVCKALPPSNQRGMFTLPFVTDTRLFWRASYCAELCNDCVNDTAQHSKR